MGEVYRARDTRLGRDVAVKVLPEEVAGSPAALARLEREARAVAALSHPGIVALFDVGEAAGVCYVVTELLDGEPLRAVVARGPLAVRRALEIAAEVAEALAAAHEQGIVHRDVKPENIVVVARDQRAKLLDFGLATSSGPALSADELTRSPTISVATAPGALRGTIAYMSPEQARGEAVDFRTDQFALGVVLYELLAGERPFVRASASETLAAILRDEPEPLGRRAPMVPAPVCWLVDRLLSKEAAGRYAATDDLARELRILLARLAELTSTSKAAAELPRPVRQTRRRLLAGLGLAVAGAALVSAGVLGERARRSAPGPTFRRLTYHEGAVGRARFTPDGQTVVYGAVWDGQEPDVYAVRLDGPEARSLGVPDAGLLAVSRSSELALSLAPAAPRRSRPFNVLSGPWTLGLVPFSGGRPRELATDVYAADFTPDGALAVSRRVAAGSFRIELPPDTVLHGGGPGERLPHVRVSPDGRTVACLRADPGRGGFDVALVERATGEIRPVSKVHDEANGLAWSPDGREVWFGAADGSWRLEVQAVDLEGRQRLVLGHLDSLIPQDLDASGRLLVVREERRTRIRFRGPAGAAERELGWFERSALNDLTRDGRMVLFQELGEATRGRNVVYVRPTDGSAAIRLGEGRFSTFAPDGRSVISAHLEGNAFTIYPLGPEPPRTVQVPGVTVDGPQLHPDGKTVLLEGRDAPDRPERVFRTDTAGGKPVPVTPEGVLGQAVATGGFLTPDGRYILARGPSGAALYPVFGGEPEPVAGLATDERVVGWAEGELSVWVIRRGEVPLRVVRLDLRTGRRSPGPEVVLADGLEAPTLLRVTPDGRSYAYFYWRVLSDLHLVEGLR